MQKIEELTLYVIALKKENVELRQENDALKTNHMSIEERLLNLERLVRN